MRQPETKYVSVGRDRVAYQVFGEGERDLLFLGPPWLSVDAVWENVGHLRIWRHVGDGPDPRDDHPVRRSTAGRARRQQRVS
jgi:hypothetical protein